MTVSDRKVMDPSGDEREPPARRPPPRYPPLSVALIAICVAVAGFNTFLGGGIGFGGGPLVEAGDLNGPAVSAGEWWRVITNHFLHAGIIHLAMNMFALWNLGRILEWVLGTKRMILVTLVSAAGASAVVLSFGYAGPGTVGISGVLCGWLGALFAVATREGRQQLMTTIIQIAVISLLPFVSWQGHLGGFLAGGLLGLTLRDGGRYFKLAAPALLVAMIGLCYVGARVGAARYLPPAAEEQH